jgi:sugar (pentulose or hexulose) kinase
VQVIADALARPVTRSAVEEGSLRGAAVAVLDKPGAAPLGDTFHPREGTAEAYRSARERQEWLYQVLRGEL